MGVSPPTPIQLVVTGRIVEHPELKRTSSGVAVGRLRLAIPGTEAMLHHNILIWGDVAAAAGDYLVPGHRIRVHATVGRRCPAHIADHGFSHIDLVGHRWEAA